MSKSKDQNNNIFSYSLMEEISAINRQLSVITLTSLSSTLPFDLIEEILSRLPVKSLLQLRCICKSFNSLICDSKFAKKHLSRSTRRYLHFLNCPECILLSYPLHSISTNFTELEYPPYNFIGNFRPNPLHYHIVCSCHGILCLASFYRGNVLLLWNPSIRKSKELPPFERPHIIRHVNIAYGFGYDSISDNYKVVVVLSYYVPDRIATHVKVHTLGTNFWKDIHKFPFDIVPVSESAGVFVSGTINWLASNDLYEGTLFFIVSFRLSNESYQKILQPDYEEVDVNSLTLGVLRDCLCMISGHDVWLMKEYGSKESWTKLFRISYMRDPSKLYYLTKALYIFEDDQILLETIGDWPRKLIVYDSRIGTFRFIKFQNKTGYDQIIGGTPEVCVESLISPCF